MDFDAKARSAPIFLGTLALRLTDDELDYMMRELAAALKEAYQAGYDDGFDEGLDRPRTIDED